MHITISFRLTTLLAVLGLIPTSRATAQTFTTLHSFTDGTGSFPYVTNSDGANPFGKLLLSGDTLYGTAITGGSSGNGTVFKINTNGSGFDNLYSFTGGNDGANPEAGLVLSGNTLYGAADHGGLSDGTVFAINTNGTSFRNLHSFALASDGGEPVGELILSGNTLYGTTIRGGGSAGTIFALNTDGTGFTKLNNSFFDNEAANPEAGVILSGNTLFGTTYQGGIGYGIVFAVNSDGTGFTNLHTFSVATSGTNSDGEQPHASLILSSNRLFGTTQHGGIGGNGTVFALNTNGTGFTTLHSFAANLDPFPSLINNDGANPQASLILSGNTLYGTTPNGGSSGYGSVFAVGTDGISFTTLYTFTATTTNSSGSYTNSAGLNPDSGLIFSGNILYGTARHGGSSGNGTLFALIPNFVQVTASPATGPAPLTVHFSAPSIDNLGNTITNWSWHFDDGSTSTLQNPSHTYTVPGSFSGNLLATKSNGVLIPETELSITVAPPTVQYSANPTNGPVPLTVQFNSPGLDSGGSAIIRWNWNFDDGFTSTAQNPSHIYPTASGGIFHPSLIATNNLGLTVVGYGPAITVPFNSGLVVNGSFETGDFTGWTPSGDLSYTFVDNGSQSRIAPSYGSYLAALATTDALGYISQTLTTTVGATYVLSCRLDSPDGQTPNEFLVSWNGNTLFDQINIPALGWTNLQFMVTATGTQTDLQFGFRDDLSYLGLDDLRVVPAQVTVNAPQLNILPSGANVILTWPAIFTAFTLQSTTNLISPIVWDTVSPVSTVVNGQNTVTNSTSVTQQYYRLNQ